MATENNVEIERKFLVNSNEWQQWSYKTIEITQGYFLTEACPICYNPKNLTLNIGEGLKVSKKDGELLATLIHGEENRLCPAKATVRVRTENSEVKLTIKTRIDSMSCNELEYTLERQAGLALLLQCDKQLQKTRYLVGIGNNQTAEVDVFHGLNAGLVVVEVEFNCRKAAMDFHAPAWFGAEVTDTKGYSNKRLSRKPYMLWDKAA